MNTTNQYSTLQGPNGTRIYWSQETKWIQLKRRCIQPSPRDSSKTFRNENKSLYQLQKNSRICFLNIIKCSDPFKRNDGIKLISRIIKLQEPKLSQVLNQNGKADNITIKQTNIVLIKNHQNITNSKNNVSKECG